jgi:hypothetical protein
LQNSPSRPLDHAGKVSIGIRQAGLPPHQGIEDKKQMPRSVETLRGTQYPFVKILALLGGFRLGGLGGLGGRGFVAARGALAGECGYGAKRQGQSGHQRDQFLHFAVLLWIATNYVVLAFMITNGT